MLNESLHSLTPEEAQVQVASITGAVTLLAIVLSAVVARLLTHPKTPKTDPDAAPSKAESLLSTYSGDQNEFISLVLKDSKIVHERLDALDGVVETMKKERTLIMGAFGRYIQKLVASWGSGGKMPYPDDEDFAILAETLPADWRHRKN